jgi:hypothetical protein
VRAHNVLATFIAPLCRAIFVRDEGCAFFIKMRASPCAFIQIGLLLGMYFNQYVSARIAIEYQLEPIMVEIIRHPKQRSKQ